jgi:hypothetical protein
MKSLLNIIAMLSCLDFSDNACREEAASPK